MPSIKLINAETGKVLARYSNPIVFANEERSKTRRTDAMAVVFDGQTVVTGRPWNIQAFARDVANNDYVIDVKRLAIIQHFKTIGLRRVV